MSNQQQEDDDREADAMEGRPIVRQQITLMNFLSAQRVPSIVNDDDDDDDESPRSPFDDLRSLSTTDSMSPIIAFNLETLSRLRDSGVSSATALALLQEAVRIGKTSVIKVILDSYRDQCLDLNAVDSLGKTPLFWSVMHGIPEITRLLLEHGADINKATLPTRSLLHWAAWQGNDEVIQCLLENGADVNAFDVYSKTPLHLCCESLNFHGSKALLNYGADPTLTDSDDCEPLHLLCANGGVRIAQLLLESCSLDVNACSQMGTPLHLACKYNHVSLVRLLVAHGADVNALHPQAVMPIGAVSDVKLVPRFSPLSSVFSDVTSGTKDEYSMLLILEYLLKKGAFVHWRQVDPSVETPIVGAMKGGFESCALLLLRHGSPIDVTVDGVSVLLKACQMRMKGFVDALLTLGIDLGDEQWLRAPEHPDSLEEELDILSVLRESHLKEPYTLKTIASSVVRARLCSLTNASIIERADQLPLPKSLISSLKLEDFDLRDYVKMSELD